MYQFLLVIYPTAKYLDIIPLPFQVTVVDGKENWWEKNLEHHSTLTILPSQPGVLKCSYSTCQFW